MNDIDLMIAESLAMQYVRIDTNVNLAKRRIDRDIAEKTRKANFEALRQELGREPTFIDMLARQEDIFKAAREALESFGAAILTTNKQIDSLFFSLGKKSKKYKDLEKKTGLQQKKTNARS